MWTQQPLGTVQHQRPGHRSHVLLPRSSAAKGTAGSQSAGWGALLGFLEQRIEVQHPEGPHEENANAGDLEHQSVEHRDQHPR